MSQNKTINRCNNCNSKISEEQLELIKENQEAVFCPYCGDHLFLKKKFIDNQTSNNEFLNDDKSSKINQYRRESFEYYITIFAARIIYDTIVQADLNSKPIESYIDKLAPALRREFSDKPINQEWLDVFRDNSRNKFKKRYKEFQTTLKRNVKYQENFLIFSKDLIKSVFDLKNSENELSTLKGIKRDIANDLINRKLFENDRRFPEIFKQNLIIALSRLIYIKMRYMAQKRNTKVNLIDLDQNVITKMAESTKNNIISITEINPQYLNKLYGITLNQFNAAYQNFRTELNASKIYSESFRYILQRLIKNVNLLISGKRESESLTNLERAIIFELKTLENRLQKNPDLLLESSVSKNLNDIKEKICIETNEKESKSQLGKYNEKTISIQKIITIEDASIYIRKVIMPELIKNKLTIQGYVPGIRVLRDNGHRDFERRIKKMKLDYSEIINFARLKKKITRKGKWAFINYNLKTGEDLTRTQKIHMSKNFFLNKIIPHLIKQKIIKKNKTPTEKEISDGGFISFIYSLKKGNYKIKYNEFLKEINFKVNRDTIKWIFLDFDENRNPLSHEQTKFAIGMHFLHAIIPFLIKNRIINSINELSSKIKNKKFQNFLEASRVRGFNYNDVLKAAGINPKREIALRPYKPRVTRKEWYDLDYDEYGAPRSKKDQIKSAARYLLNVIVPHLIKQQIIRRDELPILQHIRKYNYENFYHAIRHRNIDFENVLEAAGYEINEPKWRFLVKDREGDLLEREEKIHHAALYLVSTIVPDLISQGLIEQDKRPSKTIVRKGGHGDFMSVIRRGLHSLDYTEILKYASENLGLGLNPKETKWSFLDYDENFNKLTTQEVLNNAIDYFESIIIHDFNKKGYQFVDQAPSKSDLISFGYAGYMTALSRRGIYLNDVIKGAGFQPNEFNDLFHIGQLFHNIAECIFLYHTRKNKYYSYYEARTSYLNDENFLRRADNTLEVNTYGSSKKFNSIFQNILENRDDIMLLNVDYLLASMSLKIKYKCYKNYQGNGKYLIIVPLFAKEPMNTPENIPYHENVIILDPQSFARSIGYKEKTYEIFMKAVELSKMAVYHKDNAISELELLASKAKNIISNMYDYSTDDLVESLKVQNRLELLN